MKKKDYEPLPYNQELEDMRKDVNISASRAIKNINILIHTTPSKEEYEQAKNKYVVNYVEYEPGYSTGFFGCKYGRYIKKPDVALVKWNGTYTKGYKSWAGNQGSELNSYGQQLVINKINEIIEFLNKSYHYDKQISKK